MIVLVSMAAAAVLGTLLIASLALAHRAMRRERWDD